MKPFLKVILWICWIIVWVPLILMLFGAVNWDDVLWVIFIILGLLWQLISWLWKNIDIVVIIIFVIWIIRYTNKIDKALEASKEILERHENKLNSDFDLLYQTFKRVNRLEEKIEKLEKQLKSKKATQK